jgi:hypothetical protein
MATCRICSGGEEEGPMAPPMCMCKGSIADVHLACKMRWIRISGRSRCDICAAKPVVVVVVETAFQQTVREMREAIRASPAFFWNFAAGFLWVEFLHAQVLVWEFVQNDLFGSIRLSSKACSAVGLGEYPTECFAACSIAYVASAIVVAALIQTVLPFER